MQNLIRLLVANRLFLLFMLLELIALSWMFSSRSFQKSVYLNSSQNAVGTVLENYDELTDYVHLKKQNQDLAKQNARLKELVPELLYSLDSNLTEVEDSSYKIRYTYKSAKVVNSSYLKRQNYITINVGSIHGIEREMGVIGPTGAIGEVKEVNKHYATVIPIINPSLSISGRLKGSGFFGPVSWDGKDYTQAQVADIPRYSDVKVGDTIITDARSLIFPPGVHIGTVTSVDLQADQNFYQLDIRLATDFASINEVYIVTDKFKTEILQLQAN
jgi:rod shape-determining protein MreC